MNFKIVTLLFLSAVLYSSAGGERIITDLDDIKYGVQLDYSYNQTSTTKGFISAPGCPKSDDGVPWVLSDDKYPRCYLVLKSLLPCLFPAKLHHKMGSPIGVCRFDPNDCEPEDGKLRPPRPQNSRYSYCIPKGMTICQEIAYDNVEDKVHGLYMKYAAHQCSTRDDWLVGDSNGDLICAPSNCPYYNPFSDGATQGPSTSHMCCPDPKPPSSGISSLPESPCPVGEYYDGDNNMCIQERDSSAII